MMLSFSRTADASSFTLRDQTVKSQFLLKQAAAAVAATGIVALCAHISLPLPFTPIPVTMQTFAVLLIGMLLGPGTAVAAMVLYLAEGALGLPVFSPHGAGGLARLSGASAGYLLAYPFAALVAGKLLSAARHVLPSFVAALAASLAADALILAAGAAWLGILLHASPRQALGMGVTPFLAGEFCKVLLLAATITSLAPTQKRR